jgi:bifunctional DNase/RNase
MAAVEMELAKILIQENVGQQIIVLKERYGSRSFPIVVGIAEAFAIDRRLKGIKAPRPLTHDLVHNVIEAMGGTLEKIIVNDLREIMVEGYPEQTFFAKLIVRRGDQLIEVDSRPSDAIALGIVNNTPIFVAEHVLDEVC